MFEKLFDEIWEKNKSVKMLGIWGKDGLVLERKAYFEDEIDKDMLGAEVAEVLSVITKMSYAGERTNLSFIKDDINIYVVTVSSEYFFIAVTDKTAIPGKLQFYLKMKEKEFLSAL